MCHVYLLQAWATAKGRPGRLRTRGCLNLMSSIKPMTRHDYRALFSLSKRIEPYSEYDFFDQFCNELDSRRGFTVCNSAGLLVGLVSYSNFIPGSMVMIHFLADTNNVGIITRETIRFAFRFPFISLHVPRLVSYSVLGITDRAGKLLKRLGFRIEGILKEAGRLPDGPRDVEIYGMLREECRWL